MEVKLTLKNPPLNVPLKDLGDPVVRVPKKGEWLINTFGIYEIAKEDYTTGGGMRIVFPWKDKNAKPEPKKKCRSCDGRRDYFSMHAMQGILASPNTKTCDFSIVANDAVICADELIKALEK